MLAALLLAHAWLGLSASTEKSTTVDEMAHLTAGHALWQPGDYRLQPENGVLPQLWEGLPAVIARQKLPPPSNPGWAKPNVWTLGHVYFHQLGNDLPALLFWGRAMNLTWSIATGLLVFFWTRKIFGLPGACAALCFLVFCPTFLAHGPLATSDMCMTFFMLASVGAFWRHLQNPSPASLLLSASVTGLAFVAKYSAVLLPVMFLPLIALRLVVGPPLTWRGSVVGRIGTGVFLLASGIVHLATTFAIIWAFHRFRFEPVIDPALVRDYTRPWGVVVSSLGHPLGPVLGWARVHRVLPDAYLYGFGFVVDLSRQRGAFLNGQNSLTGWVQFFPYAFLAKTPLAFLAALLAVIGVTLHRWRTRWGLARSDLLRVAPLLSLFVVYWAFSLKSTLNIGHRHLLPTYPVLFIAVGALGWAAANLSRAWRWLLAVLLVGQVTASALIRPHYLAFFNQLVGGPTDGYRHLVDSSLDWGQDLPGLAAWLRQQQLPRAGEPVYLAYFGTGEPDYYGIHAIPMVPLLRTIPDQPWHRLEPGVYCISATLLQQTYSEIRPPWSDAYEKEYTGLRSVEPALIDYSRHPDRRPAWEATVPAEKWPVMWRRYEELRFGRLCAVLRQRTPDAQIGYSINIYRLSAEDIALATGDVERWRRAVTARP